MANSPPKDLTQLTDLPLMSEYELAQSAEESPTLEGPSPENVSEADFDLSPTPETAQDFNPPAFAQECSDSNAHAPTLAQDFDFAPPTEMSPASAPLELEMPTPHMQAPESLPAASTQSPLESIVNHEATRSAVAASDPFTLRITGELRPEERARLLDILSREALGIREVDLEPQFAMNQILLPRISEYLGVQIVQALRSASVRFEFAPSDGIPEAKSAPAYTARVESQLSAQDARMRFEEIPVTQDTSLPGLGVPIAVDVVTASATLSSAQVEARHSHAYEEIVENLKRELKARAYYRGAQAIMCFEIQLTPLKDPGLYRLTLAGSAVKIAAHAKPSTAGVSEEPPIAERPSEALNVEDLDLAFRLPK